MSGAGSVLVIDDNLENRALARATLDDAGYAVALAADGEAGIAAFARNRPDCVLLDVRMPGLDGPATCERLRALPGGADVPIVFVTAQRDLDTFDRTVTAGGDDFMTKPFRPTELVARVEAALKLRRLAVERRELYAQVKQQREDVQRLQLQKEQLIAFLVHDLKNPVHAIDLYAQQLLRDRDANARTHRVASRIRDEDRALIRMITTLLDIAKADEGRLVPAAATVDLAALVAGICAELEVRASASGVTLASEVASTRVDADPDLLRRILENLVDNAIRHAPEGTTVRIATRPSDGGTLIRIQDAGPGVPVAARERVFDRYVQSGASSRANRGLGLAFCKLAIEAHGGRVWVEDAEPGAAFCVWLPAAA